MQPWLPPLTLLLGLLTLALTPADAAPSTPKSDDEIVEHLPYRLDPGVRAVQARIAQGSLELPQALQAARSAIERGRREGDPRELGLAQAALAPWWAQAEPPPAVRLLRATVRQAQHDFDTALNDLVPLTRADSAAPLAVQAQALLTTASVLQVTGRIDEARAGCERLATPRFAALGAGVAVLARTCLAELASLQGQGETASAELANLAQQNTADAAWLALVRAELAERRGEPAAAEHYLQAVQDAGGVYARAAYADWLQAQGRPADVLHLLPAEAAQADALALRRAIALHALNAPEAAAASENLRLRFEEARLRGDATHAREEARFRLDVLGQPDAALALAQANWRRQKEPADALLLARCAVAAGQADALLPLRRFVKKNHWADVRLAAIDKGLQP
jgi:hypothetical protein